MAPRRSWCVRALLLPSLLLGCGGGENEVGPRIPASIVVVPNEPRVPLGQTKQLTATVVDQASLTLLRTVEVGGSVRRVAVRADGVVLAANEGGWVDVIE